MHCYLQNRLKDYDIEQHFGGVRYLFVRGMLPEIPLSGVYAVKPASEKIVALADLFSDV